MSRVTSRQRRANDRRRYWFGYAEYVAAWDGLQFGPDEASMRAMYRSHKSWDHETTRRARRGIPAKQCITVPCPSFEEVQF